ncbi:glycosyltransferase [Catenulispora subtropica]|uniref:Glycosyltransferase n=1 Tax=Catenulispora subtropica TaxID=450798 RepID=A0ABN2RL06_9ACTN
MRVLIFGTYDVAAHPRVGVIAEGLRAAGHEVRECNAPLGFDTAARVRMLAQPWRVPALGLRLARCWLRLTRGALRGPRPDVVVVGYLGHFDVHLARMLFGRRRVVLDHLIGAADTARDRQVNAGLRQPVLRAIDAAALSAAHVVVVDTEEHRETLPAKHRGRAVVVPVGAPDEWFEQDAGPDGGPLRVVFYGLFTPLQGAATIGTAIARLAGRPVEFTMVGGGQDKEETLRNAGAATAVTWRDWVPAAELPGLVAAHDVCLGIFGTGPKARRVVPNKVYQGAAAGCAIVTSDTPPQRRAFGDAAVYVPPGDAEALAAALADLAENPERLRELRQKAGRAAREHFTPEQVVQPLLAKLGVTAEPTKRGS